jgi:alkylation response protein AidB-like acyl-CoA dehydrogenase
VDFSLSEEHQAVADLARQILEGQETAERLKEVEAGPDLIDRRTYAELAKANLLGVALPEAVGGSGLGFAAACVILEQIGRTVAPVPFLPTVVLGALPIAEFGTDQQKQRLLAPAIAGELILTAALVESGTEPDQPATTATPLADGGWRLDGTKICVPAAAAAGCILVAARTNDARTHDGGDSVGVFLLDPASSGVTLTPLDTTNSQPESRLELAGAVVGADGVLGDPYLGRSIVTWMLERATTALCAVAAGVCEVALRTTAEYTKTREQFERPIASFQAVGQRLGDAYIDAEAVRLTAWQAAWRLDAGMPAAAEVAVAKYWAAEGGQRVVHAGQHLHGGIGVDRDYPLHRYFLWAKHVELSLGGATRQLLHLGAMLAAEPV